MKLTSKVIPAVKLLIPASLFTILLWMMTRRMNITPPRSDSDSQCNPAYSIIADETTYPTITPRFQFFLHPPGYDQFISGSAYASGGNPNKFFESEERNFMLHVLKQFPGAEILDIGANIGTHTLFFGLSGLKVHAFEPLKANFKLLECSMKVNEINNIIINNVALGPKHGDLCMHPAEIDLNNFGGVHLTNVSASLCDPSIKVKVVPLGEYLERNNVKPVFIKIDIEGSELNALSSAKEYFKKYPPKHIYSEFAEYNMRKVGTIPEDYWNFLVELGYSVYNFQDTIHFKSFQEMPSTANGNIFIHAVHDGVEKS